MITRTALVAVLAISPLILRGIDAQGEIPNAQTIPCAQLSNGNYVWGCSSFYSACSNGYENIMHCYGELVLNPDNNRCDLPRNVWACQNPQSGAIYRAREPFTCTGKKDGYYPSEQCSNSYIVCLRGNLHTQKCPGGTVFNGQQGVCDFSENCSKSLTEWNTEFVANKQVQSKPDKMQLRLSPTMHRIAASPKRQSTLYMQRNSAYTLTQSEHEINLPVPPVADAFIVNSGAINPIPDDYNDENNDVAIYEPPTVDFPLAEFDCDGKADGIYFASDAALCVSSFWKCANGYAYEFICPSSLLYDIESQQCTQREFITACGGIPPTLRKKKKDPSSPFFFDCTERPNGWYEPVVCSEFYYACYGGVTWPFRCSQGLVFDKASTNCVYPIECGSRRPLQQDEEQDSLLQQNLSYSLQLPKVATPSTTTTISTTTKAPFNCAGKPDGYYYKRKCKSSFIVCSKGQMSQQHCPQGLLFDPSLANCQYADVCGKSTTTRPPTTTTTITAQTTMATTPKPDFNCTGKANGYYSKRPCTSTFYSCAQGYTIQLTCPPLLVFDPMTNICEYPNVCGSTITTTPAGVESDATQSSQSSAVASNPPVTQLPKQTNLSRTKTTKAKAPITTITTPKPISLPFDCNKKNDGHYAIKPCQKDYVTCISNKAYAATCQGGLVYDEINQFCNYPRNCKIQKTTTTTTTIAPSTTQPTASPQHSPAALPVISPAKASNALSHGRPKSDNGSKKAAFTCHGKPDGIYMTKNCNTRYIHCWHNQTTRMTCPGVLVYDATTHTCEYKDACGKAKAKPVPADLTTPSFVGTATTVKIDFDCIADGIFAQGHCQHKYIMCSKGTPYQYYCGGNLVYDENTQNCEYAEQCGLSPSKSYRANEVEEDVKVVDSEQQQPHYYAATSPSLSTAFPSNAIAIVDDSVANEENSGLCGQIPVGTHAISNCISNYIICTNSKISFGSCSNGHVYDQKTGTCLPAINAGCGVTTASPSPPTTTDAVTTATVTATVSSTVVAPKNSYDEMSPINQQMLKRRTGNQ